MDPVTLKDVARATGLAVATVSYALRGAPNISAVTTERVRRVARELGYCPNPRIAELMASIRRGGPVSAGGTIAWVRVERGAGEFSRTVQQAAAARAEERGYRLEAFPLGLAARQGPRVAAILRARGIRGVVFAPAMERTEVRVEWPWAEFAMAVVGVVDWGVKLSRSAHHHHVAMVETVRRLRIAGSKRPLVLMSRAVNERAQRARQGAWLAYAGPGAARRLKWTESLQRVDLRRDLATADGLVADTMETLNGAREAGWAGPGERTALLAWTRNCNAVGVEQRYDVAAGDAVDLVIAQLLRGETGLPAFPRTLLVPGVWRTLAGEVEPM